MRVFLLYFAWFGMWILSSLSCSKYNEAVSNAITLGLNEMETYNYINSETGIIIELARTMIFTALFIFIFLAVDRKEKSIAYQKQLEGVSIIVAAKMVEHWFGALNTIELLNINISPYIFNIINYTLAILYIPVTWYRIKEAQNEKSITINT